MPKILLFVLIFLTVLFFSALKIDSSDKVEREEVALRLEILAADEDRIDVALIYDGTEALCGVICEVTFDYDLLISSGACEGKDLEDDAHLTHAQTTDGIILLLDSSDTLGCGELAVISFLHKGGSGGVGEIRLSGGYGKACIFRDGKLTRAHLSENTLICDGLSRDVGGAAVGLSVNDRGLTLCGITDQNCCFLVFDVTVTDIYGEYTQKYSVCARPKMNDNGFFTASAHLDGVCDDGDVIVVKPVYYGRERAEVGSETVFILYNGKILTVDEKAVDD